jgi:flagellar motor switch protein FliG
VSSELALRGPGLNGLQKTAMLLVSLGPERASELFGHLKDAEIEALSLEMAKVRRVASNVAGQLARELVDTVRAEDYMVEGGVEYAHEVLERAMGPERAAEIIGRLSATIERRPFEFLRRTPPEHIYMFLKNEPPQTMAVVVANLHTSLAAKVLSEMPPEQQAEVAMRIARMGETRPDVVRRLEASVRERLSTIASQESAATGGAKPLAEILSRADRTTERNVLGKLGTEDPELAEQVRMLLFTFDDLVKLDDRAIQLVLKDVETKDLAVALRGVSDDVRERIFANMSERGGQMLREEMEFQPPQRRRAIEEAQGRIVAVVRRLEEANSLVISRGVDDEVI